MMLTLALWVSILLNVAAFAVRFSQVREQHRAAARRGGAAAVLHREVRLPADTLLPRYDVYALDSLINELCVGASGVNEPGGWILNRLRARKIIARWVNGLAWRRVVADEYLDAQGPW